MVVAEEDVLDARFDITPDKVKQWRRWSRDSDFSLRRVQQSLRCILLWPDENYLLSSRIDIDEHRRAIDHVTLDLVA